MPSARSVGLLTVVLFLSGVLAWGAPVTLPGVLAVTLIHVVIAAVATLALAAYVPFHLRATTRTRHRPARASGWVTTVACVVVVGSGIAALVPEASLGEGGAGAVRGLHFVSAAAIVVILWVHRFHAPRDVMGVGEIGVVIAAFALVALVGGLAPPREPPALVQGEPLGALAELRVAAGGTVTPDVLADTARCRPCHAAITAQWENSAHRHASFANPFYLHGLRALEEARGRGATRFCASCHDPVALLDGVLDDEQRPLSAELPRADRGVTCLMCHAAAHPGDGSGNGSLTLGRPPALWPGDPSPAPAGALGRVLVNANPDAHRARVSGAATLSPDLCGSCHEVALPPEVTGYRFMPGFNTFDDWQQAPDAHRVALPLGHADERDCADCHMPRVAAPGDPAAAADGTVASHDFAAANTALAAFVEQTARDGAGAATWTERIHASLARAEAAAVPIAISSGSYREAPIGDGVTLVAGAELVVHTLVRALGVGHGFPGGTADSHETWVELTVTGSDGRVIAQHGAPGSDGGPPPDAHVLRARPLDERGDPIVLRDAFRARTVLYNSTVPAGAGTVVRFAFSVPPDEPGPVRITTHLWFRKFAGLFYSAVSSAVARDHGAPLPAQERVLLGERTITASIGARPRAGDCPGGDADREDALRYMSAATLQGDHDMAIRAAERAIECGFGAPAWIKKARTLLRAQRPADALAALDQLDDGALAAPGQRMIIAAAAAAMGDDARALGKLGALAAAFPRDRALHRQLARLSLRSGDPAGALTAADAVLAVDRRDVEGCYLRMLAAAELGRADVEAEARACYELHREDETRRALRRTRRAADPHDDLEAQPRHIHRCHHPADGGTPGEGRASAP